MQYIVFDIETESLTPQKIHCLSFCVIGIYEVKTIYTIEEIVELFATPNTTFVGHYIANFDIPTIHRLTGVDFTHIPFYDTIYLSNYIYPGRLKYSLESFGEDFKVYKKEVKESQWDGDMNDPEFRDLMTTRCESDIRINTNLYVSILKRLETLYDGDQETIDKLLAYMAFKARRALEQQLNPLLIDVQAAEDLLVKLYAIKQDKESALVKVMTKIPVYTTKSKPKVMYTKDGELSVLGKKWLDFLQENGLPADNTKDVRIIKGWEEPNPQSHSQIKSWLESLNWQPDVFRYERNKETNERKAIPQVLDENKELTPSVKLLAEEVPELYLIEGLGVVNHRIALVSGLLETANKNGGWVPQTLKGITSTFRFKHSGVVNIPSVSREHGKEIRALFIAPKDMLVMSVDVKNLESRTRDASIQPLDPLYVEEMSQPEFDAHLDTSIAVKLITKEESDFYKFYKSTYIDGGPTPTEEEKTKFKDIDVRRKRGKIIGFSSIYNVGAKTLSISLKESEAYCKNLLHGFWERNWAIKSFAESLPVKTCLGSKWIKSQVGNGFFLELRKDNDKFSAHNQNFGVTFFDTWCGYLELYGIVIRLQSHDEILLYVKPSESERTKAIINKCCDLANKKLKLNIRISVDIQMGINYSETH